MNIVVEVDPAADDLALIGARLSDFNAADVGPSGRITLAVFARDEDAAILGGLSGYTAWGWLYVQWLFVDERARGRNLAGGMLEAAEQEAARRGCHGAYIDTFNPVALKVYQRQGYEPFGALADFPPGRTRTFLQKRLPAAISPPRIGR